jgi:twitching motility protein PilJ
MATSIDNYLEIYKQACTAYAQQNYEVAAGLVDQVVQNVPDDPNCHLLRGHIYYVLQQYSVAATEYKKVLQLTDDPEIIGFANSGLENINQYQELAALDNNEQIDFTGLSDSQESSNSELQDLGALENFDSKSFDLNSFDEYQPSMDVEDLSLDSPFTIPQDSISSLSEIPDFSNDPFSLHQHSNEQESEFNSEEKQVELELPVFWQEEKTDENHPNNSNLSVGDANSGINHNNSTDSPFTPITFSKRNSLELAPEILLEENYQEPMKLGLDLKINSLEDETLLMEKERINNVSPQISSLEYSSPDNSFSSKPNNWLEQIESQDQTTEKSSSFNSKFSAKDQPLKVGTTIDTNNFDGDEDLDFEAFESAFGSENLNSDEEINKMTNGGKSQGNIEFLDDFDEFDDLGNIPGFDLSESDSSFSDAAMFSSSLETSGSTRGKVAESIPNNADSDRRRPAFPGDRDEELFTITGSHEAVPAFNQTEVSKIEPQITVEQGWLASLDNALLETKQLFISLGVGAVSAVVVATVTFVSANVSPPQHRASVQNTGWVMALAAGLAGGVTASFMGNLALRQVRRTTKDLQTQFDAVCQGNLNAQATVYSKDELGQLASSFNEMARVIFTTTHDAQRKADEQEEAKENLQRQVIRLLDDVEGAARGDLTVQAEVTADVLGAVADAFNLTIQNLRDIVQQVKVAAKEVTKGATNSETFARALSSDALRQAEELAVTLNSVQVMTDSIQRVAEAAREAETVARDASTIALKGGEAVENTVAGILEIRETVAETTRKVKRLAESSQEISKIVALISQIASRTNLLALNASIEAARAGEAGRGFAIVADEVRQLADKSAKSLKEIEQIVMQIQSETGSVMTAMEEGTQQVIKGTKLAEEAKRSLENIIQVANRIDILVRSITSDTVEQTETSRAVAHVMQSVELTAQENSQEAQRVSGALQNLVGVSRDLIASVERFRVETPETK